MVKNKYFCLDMGIRFKTETRCSPLLFSSILLSAIRQGKVKDTEVSVTMAPKMKYLGVNNKIFAEFA